MRISYWSSDVCSSYLNTCITGNAAIIAGVSALAGLPGLSNICTGVRGNAGSSTGVQPSLASQAGQHLPYDNRFVVRNADGSINPDLSYAAGADRKSTRLNSSH